MEKQVEYKYYSTQRPIDIGTYPKGGGNDPIKILNYDQRLPVEYGAFPAWGELDYLKPLPQEALRSYELRPSRANPDVWKRMDEQAQTVGAWEEAGNVPDEKRLTWYHPDFGSYVPKEFVTPERLAECVRGIETQRAARAHREAKQPIAEQLKAAERLAGEHQGQPTQKKTAPDRGDR